jgi:surface antigen
VLRFKKAFLLENFIGLQLLPYPAYLYHYLLGESGYHQLTDYWVAWKGHPYQWVTGARAAGWHVSPMPHASSIMVLMPYVQGAGGYGHVAVVEGINADGSVHTSDMNWFINGGDWDKVSYADFTAGAGVYFIWHP